MSRLVIDFDEKRLLCKQIEIRAEHDGRRRLRASGVIEVRLSEGRLEYSMARRRKPAGVIEFSALRGVYAQNKAGWTGLAVVRIVADDAHIDLVLPADADAVAVARDIAGRDLPPWQRGQMTGVALR